jgi:hypothetical protein
MKKDHEQLTSPAHTLLLKVTRFPVNEKSVLAKNITLFFGVLVRISDSRQL